MMNYIWMGMLMLGILFAAITGQMSTFSNEVLGSAKEAVQFVIGLAGIMAIWSGIMNIAKETGLMDVVARLASPFVVFLFPRLKNREAISTILMSFTANLFGAGNSATVFSIQAMTHLDEENKHRGDASNAMCMFVAVNMSMVQLVPITVLAIRGEAGSQHPESIIVPSILAGLISMVVSILMCKYYEGKDAAWQKS